MTEEQGQTAEATEAPAATAAPPEKLDRKTIEATGAYRGLKKQLDDALARAGALEQAQADAEQKRLEAQGEYKTLAERLEAKLAERETQYARDIATKDATIALTALDIRHPAAQKGFIADYLSMPAEERPTPEEWAASIKADPINAIFFSTNAPPVGAGPNAGAASRAGAGVTDADLASTDPHKRDAARAAVFERVKARVGG